MTTTIEAIAVAVPACDEQERIVACLDALEVAAAVVDVPVRVAVAADRCTDATVSLALSFLESSRSLDGSVVVVDCGSAGGARQAAALAAVEHATRVGGPIERVWLASTDSDSVVDADWLQGQLRWASSGRDGVAGLVRLEPGTDLRTVGRYERYVRARGIETGHRHVHGANLGLRADWWAAVGGFPEIATGEDHVMWDRLATLGARLIGVTDLGVATSSRTHGRAPHGLSDLLGALVA